MAVLLASWAVMLGDARAGRRRAGRARPAGLAADAAGAAAVGLIAAIAVAVVVRASRPRPAHGLVRAAGDRAAHPHPRVLRQPGGQPAGAPLRRDPARPRRLRVGADPRPHRPPRPGGAGGPERPAGGAGRLLPGLVAVERRPRGGRGQGRLLLHPLHCALPAGAGLVAAGRGRSRPWRSPRSPGAVVAALVGLWQYAAAGDLVERDPPAGERLQPLLPRQRHLLRPQHPRPLPGDRDPRRPRPRVGAPPPGGARGARGRRGGDGRRDGGDVLALEQP